MLFIYVCILLVFIYCRNVFYNGNTLYNGFYMNHKHEPAEKEMIARTIVEIRQKADTLVNIVRAEHPKNERVNRLVHSWNGIIHEMEHSLIQKRVFAYNVNKGDSIAVCMHGTNNQMNTPNELFFVVMHEMAHIMTERYEHNDEFWDSYRMLIRTASSHGIFENIDYNKTPHAFCGDYIDHNPTFSLKKNMDST